MRKYGIFGILFLSLCLFGAVHTAYAAEEEESLQITQEELLDEFDFSDLDDSLKKRFPREKMTFRDVVETLVSGDLKKAGASVYRLSFSISFSMNCRHTGNFWYI